ncbi:MAG: hypothetical protein CMP09_20520 [Yangia sp.]|nr:hypothetical protein [Salipiger sp.]
MRRAARGGGTSLFRSRPKLRVERGPNRHRTLGKSRNRLAKRLLTIDTPGPPATKAQAELSVWVSILIGGRRGDLAGSCCA